MVHGRKVGGWVVSSTRLGTVLLMRGGAIRASRCLLITFAGLCTLRKCVLCVDALRRHFEFASLRMMLFRAFTLYFVCALCRTVFYRDTLVVLCCLS